MENDLEKKKHVFGFTALFGPPNSGKSTLLNAFLGEKISIVSEKPQTTRNNISGILSREEGQIVFLDTPGIHLTNKTLNKHMVNLAWQALERSDILLLVLDAYRYIYREDKLYSDLTPIIKPVQKARQPLIIATNKIDLIPDKNKLLPLIDNIRSFWPESEIIPISAINLYQTEILLQKILQALPPGPSFFPEDQLSDLPMRFIASEIIREKLFLTLYQEVPYSTAVQITHWEENERDTVFISSNIYVSQKSQKRIIIGKKGSRIKQIGMGARKELEDILDKKVYLDVWVKIKPAWDEDINFILNLDPR